MSEIIEVSIAGITTELRIENNSLKKVYDKVINDLNLECNNIIIDIGCNIDKTILLFFLLLKIELLIHNDLNPIDIIFRMLKKLGKFIIEKNEDKKDLNKELENIKKVREFLIYCNIKERVRNINVKEKKDSNDKIIDLVKIFSGNIKDSINILQNELPLL